MTAAHPQIANGLRWLRAELENSLSRARAHLEFYLENVGERAPLVEAAEELRVVRGTLSMVRCMGAAGLADEMYQLLREVLDDRAQDAHSALATLFSATLHLSDYLDLLTRGEQDRAVVLQPWINELRLIGGKPIRTEADLFAAQVRALDLEPRVRARVLPYKSAQDTARRELTAFQTQLLRWFKGIDATESLGALGRIADELTAACKQPQLQQFWGCLSVLSECLVAAPEAESLDLKRLFGRGGMLVKTIAESGESLAAEQIGDAAYLGLYFIARSAAPSERARALREALDLGTLAPPAEALEAIRRRLAGPNTAALSRVNREIREDFQKIKDGIDLAVRTSGRDPTAQRATWERLHQLAAALRMLGLAGPQQALSNLAARLSAGGALDTSVWLEAATTILAVEHGLDEALFRSMHPEEPAAAAQGYSGSGPRPPHVADVREATGALVHQSLINCARLKSAVDGFLANGQDGPLADAPLLFSEIAAGLGVLDQHRASGLTRQLQAYAQTGALNRLRGDAHHAARFADAVSALEIFLEALRDNAPQLEAHLDALARYIAALAPLAPAERAMPTAVSDEPAPSEAPQHIHAEVTAADAAPAQPLPDATAAPAGIEAPVQAPAPAPVAEEVVPPTAPAAAPVVATAPPAAEEVDEEIREVFLDEAAEVLATLQQTLPALQRDAQNREALVTVRRAFHTLKGSGRMVGATGIGDFAWSIEHLLNRCLDGSLALRAPILAALEQAVALLPALVEAFRARQPHAPEVDALIERAKALLTEPQAAPAPAQPDLHAVFQADLAERAQAVQQWLAAASADPGAAKADPELVRAFHTIRGSASIVQSEAVAQLANGLEGFLNAATQAQLPVGAAGVELVREGWATIEAWSHVAAAGGGSHDVAGWLERLDAARHALVAPAAERPGRDLRHAHSMSAVDDLDGLEHSARAWQAQPVAPPPVPEWAAALQAFAGRFDDDPQSGLPQAARALAERISEEADVSTDAVQALLDRLEPLRQAVDEYRDAGAGAVPAELLAAARPWPHAPVSQAPVPAPSEEAGTPTPPAAVEAPPPSDVAPAPAPAGELDELGQIFLEEAGELLDQFEGHLALMSQAADSAVPADVRQVLHTLHGSALMAGFESLGSDAGRLEQAIEDADRLPQARGSVRQTLAQGAQSMRAQLEQLRRFGRPAPSEQPAEPAAAPAVAPPEPIQAAASAVVAPARPSAAEATVPGVEEPGHSGWEGQDRELVEIFVAEAVALLEGLEAAVESWLDHSRESDLREVLRLLHSVKGAARIAGQTAMGEEAHNLETRLAEIQDNPELLDPDMQRGVRESVGRLIGYHERLVVSDPAVVPGDGREPERTAAAPAAAGVRWSEHLSWTPPDFGQPLSAGRREAVRVPVDVLDTALNNAGEISITRSRMEQHAAVLRQQLAEVHETIGRVREHLRMLDIETEAQIAARGRTVGGAPDPYAKDFDPLEMDRYSRMQELSRALVESVNDVALLHQSMIESVGESEALLLQQARVNTDMQQRLMDTLMVPFSRQVPKLVRLVRQTATENGRQAQIYFEGAAAELDRHVLDRMGTALEHILRNAIVHGLEPPEERIRQGKSPVGRIDVILTRENAQLLIQVRDDGRGLDFDAIRRKAIERGLMRPDAKLSDDDVASFIFEPGFSTAAALTRDAGRGVGLDVVSSEVKQLGGTIELRRKRARGTTFLIRLPVSLALSNVLLVDVQSETYAMPLATVAGIVRVPRAEIEALQRDPEASYTYADRAYRFYDLADLVAAPRTDSNPARTVPMVLIGSGEGLAERHFAVAVDRLLGNRQIVSKPVGAQVTSVTGISGATILPDGRVVLILDVAALAAERSRREAIGRPLSSDATPETARPAVLVVDDSVTVRRVTERLLTRNGYRVITAKDGLDALAVLQKERPGVILLDIEMPRADGFEVAASVRHNQRLAGVPIIMVTSRSSEKHRARALSLGVNRYLVKPYQEDQLLQELTEVGMPA